MPVWTCIVGVAGTSCRFPTERYLSPDRCLEEISRCALRVLLDAGVDIPDIHLSLSLDVRHQGVTHDVTAAR
jgi:hypothetical protein